MTFDPRLSHLQPKAPGPLPVAPNRDNPAALVPAGLEPPPASPFDAPPTTAEVAAAERSLDTASAVEQRVLGLNRAQRRKLRHQTLADVRLLARVVRWDLATNFPGKGDAPYPNERAATYGFERAAKAMRQEGLLTRSEEFRMQQMTRSRRAALKP